LVRHFFLLRAKRRAWIPPLGWWLSLALGTIIFFYGMSHSTMPSFSARITAVGRAYDYMEREIHTGYHHDTIYRFRFVLSDRHAGFHDSLDARPAGAWLAIPVGAAFLGFGLAGLKSMKEDAIAAASDDDDSST
jgi:hypothetical protein